MLMDSTTEDFSRLHLDHMIDLRHALAVLASRMPWQEIEASVAHLFSRKVKLAKHCLLQSDLHFVRLSGGRLKIIKA
jgi:hypothetical protein